MSVLTDWATRPIYILLCNIPFILNERFLCITKWCITWNQTTFWRYTSPKCYSEKCFKSYNYSDIPIIKHTFFSLSHVGPPKQHVCIDRMMQVTSIVHFENVAKVDGKPIVTQLPNINLLVIMLMRISKVEECVRV